MAWRKAAATGPAAAAVAELESYADAYRAAGAAEQLAAVESWLAMLGMGGSDPEVAELFLEFARPQWESWSRGVA